MKIRNIFIFAAAVFAGAIGGSIIGPRPAEAVAREILDLQRDVTTLLQNQKDMSDQMLKDHTVLKTLVEQASDNVGKLNGTMANVQKTVQDVQANSGARLDTMSTQVQGLSDNLEEIKSRLGKLNQQLVDLQSAVQGIDSKVSGSAPASGTTSAPTGGTTPKPSNNVASPDGSAAAGPPPSADMLYSNGLRDITSGKYDLARQEFLDYLKYYSDTDLASNAQFYLGEIAYAQKQYQDAVAEYDKVLTGYPKSFKLAPARLKKGLALIALGQKTSGVRELREVIRRYPKTDEDRIAEGELKKLGVSVSGAS
ncbi:MAG: tol-pal system protein YbgF [Candidatus Acidiferrum sp.]|jgi:tol-pal system protein YbgF